MNLKKILQVSITFIITIAILASGKIFPDISDRQVALISIGLGVAGLAGQLLIPADRPATQSKISGRQQRLSVAVAGACAFVIGIILLLIG